MDHPLYREIHRRLAQLVDAQPGPSRILDVGGRSSNYTVGLRADVFLTELPRTNSIQRELNLGLDRETIITLKKRRSNIVGMAFEDMTRSALADSTFDIVAAIEVLEHVEADDRFLAEVRRVLKPGGCFLMTTPNGNHVPNRNPDHKRHYTRSQLAALLEAHFGEARVESAVRHDRWFEYGSRRWTLRHPLRTALSMLANLVTPYRSGSESDPMLYLMAVAKK